jgi:hypothetical protein
LNNYLLNIDDMHGILWDTEWKIEAKRSMIPSLKSLLSTGKADNNQRYKHTNKVWVV